MIDPALECRTAVLSSRMVKSDGAVFIASGLATQAGVAPGPRETLHLISPSNPSRLRASAARLPRVASALSVLLTIGARAVSEFSAKLSDEVRSMSALAEASGLLRRVAEPCPAGDTAKAAMLRAWRCINVFCSRSGVPSWSFNRVRDVWRPDPRIRVRAEELDALRTLLRHRRQELADKAVRHEFTELQQTIARLAILEKRMAAIDAEFFEPQAAALRAASRGDE